MALVGLFREADIGRGLEDMALEGLSCLAVPAAEPGLTISTEIMIKKINNNKQLKPDDDEQKSLDQNICSPD